MNVWFYPPEIVLITLECGLGFWSSQSTPVILRYSWCGKHCSGSYHGSYGVFIGKPFNLEFFPSLSNFPSSVVTQSCPTLCDPMDCSTPGFPVHHQFPELTQTHVHRVGDAIQPFHLLSFPSPPTFNLSLHQGLCQRVSSSHQVAKVLEFQLQHQSFQWIFRTDLL